MSETFTVTKARYAGEKDNPHGGKLHKFYCSFVDESGNGKSDVYWQRKSEQSPEGEKFYGHIEEGEFGPRFKTDQNPNGSQPRSGSSLQGKDDYWAKREQRDVESQARQGRAHAQEMAIRVAAQTNLFGDVDFSKTTATKRDIALNSLTWLIDWFHQDVQRFPLETGSRPVNGSSRDSSAVERGQSKAEAEGSNPSPGAAQPELPSPAQKSKITQLLNKNVAMAHHADLKAQATSKADATQLISRLIKVDAGEADVPKLLAAYNITPESDVPWSDDA